MLQGVYIFRDDDFDLPLYADPDTGDLEPEVWEALVEAVSEALDGEARPEGHVAVDEVVVGWKVLLRVGLSFAAVCEAGVLLTDVESYLRALARHYMDEVDDPRKPERDGVEDVVVDVLPPWEE
jgi:hypothetical protein